MGTLKRISPADGEIPQLAENFYSFNLSLADFVALGDVATADIDISTLLKNETLTAVSVLVKQVPNSDNITTFVAKAGVKNSSDFISPFNADLGAASANVMLGGFSNGIVSGKDTVVKALTYTTLLDSITGDCTPDAATANSTAEVLTSSDLSSGFIDVAFNSSDARKLHINLVIAGGDDFSAMDAGNVTFFFWTKTIPATFI